MAIDPIYNLKFTTVDSVSGNDITVADPSMLRDDVAAFIDNDFLVWAAGETPTPSNSEYVRPTADVSGTFTLSRQQQGSSLRTITVGDYIALAPTKLTFDQLQSQIDAKFASADVIDEDDMSSDSATKVPTQQSVKAYVDTEVAGAGGGATTLDGLTDVDTTGAADGDVLTFDGTGWVAETPAGGGGGSSTPRAVMDLTPFSSTFWTEGNSGGGAVTYNNLSGGYTRVSSETTSGGRGWLRRSAPFAHAFKGSVLKNVHGWATVRISGGAGNGNAYFRFMTTNGLSSSNTVHQMGYKFIKSGGTITTSATNGDGTTETATNVTSSLSQAVTQGLSYNAVKTDGTNIKYYENGTLLATHTTNLPGSTSSEFYNTFSAAWADNASSTDIYVIDISSGNISWEMY